MLSKLKKIITRFYSHNENDMVNYWKNREEKYGERSVINVEHDENFFVAITEYQKQVIFPILKKYLNGDEKKALDFGCGPARFTKDIAQTINGLVVGIDIVPAFIKVAKEKDPINTYFLIKGTTIPMENEEIDVIWICLVLGGISEKNLYKIKKEIIRISKKNSLLILIENTTEKKDAAHWFYRNISFYSKLFTEFDLKLETKYEDLGETISVLIGRKK